MSSASYTSIAKLFHWGMALLIIGMLAVGLYMVGMPNSPDKFQLYGWHKALGAILLGLLVLRLLWRLTHRPPAMEANMPALIRIAAHLGHLGLYACMLAMPVTGWVMSSAAGYPVSVFGWFNLPALVEKNQALAKQSNELHTLIAYAFIALIVVHILGALYHHIIRKDGVLTRMLPMHR